MEVVRAKLSFGGCAARPGHGVSDTGTLVYVVLYVKGMRWKMRLLLPHSGLGRPAQVQPHPNATYPCA